MSYRIRTISIALAIAVIGGLVFWKCRGSGEPAVIDAAVAVPLTKARLKLRDLARQRPGTVRGTVTATAGGPIENALVCQRL